MGFKQPQPWRHANFILLFLAVILLGSRQSLARAPHFGIVLARTRIQAVWFRSDPSQEATCDCLNVFMSVSKTLAVEVTRGLARAGITT